MKNKDFSNDLFLENLKNVLCNDCNNDLIEVSLDNELSPYNDLSESDLLGKAKSTFEDELHNNVLLHEKKVTGRLDRLKSYDDDIFS